MKIEESKKKYKYTRSRILFANILGLFFSIFTIVSLIILIRGILLKADINIIFLVSVTTISCMTMSVFLIKTYNSSYVITSSNYVCIKENCFNHKHFNIDESSFLIDGDTIKITSQKYDFGKIHLDFLDMDDRLNLIKVLNLEKV